ncbi:hypothetical protein E4U61_007071 [Claviceps capensis]|nr:hypothetical protein E4U61_007071 [Claviceps capensis]
MRSQHSLSDKSPTTTRQRYSFNGSPTQSTDELGLDGYGNPAVCPYIADRLRNEAAVLQFIAKHTTIPVPEFLDLWEENGLVYLKTALVESAVELRHVDESLLSEAIMRVAVPTQSFQ